MLEAVRMRPQGSGCGEERIGGDMGALFLGRVLSEDRDSVFRNMRYREQAGMMPAPSVPLELQEL